MCKFQKHKSIATLTQLYFYCFSLNSSNYPCRSWRVVGQRLLLRRQLPLGWLTFLPSLLYCDPPQVFGSPLYVVVWSRSFLELTQRLQHLGNRKWADRWCEQPPSQPQAVLSSSVCQSSCEVLGLYCCWLLCNLPAWDKVVWCWRISDAAFKVQSGMIPQITIDWTFMQTSDSGFG